MKRGKKSANERAARNRCIPVVYARSRGICERCGRREGESYHHRVNRSQGGWWTVDNIVHLCGDGVRGCHGWVTEHPSAAADEGFHVKRWEDPASVPILLHGAQRVLLRNDGTYHYMEEIEE
ncbi:hypothetical protein Wildcat_77 [Mycobacterium phage Wildcat]|uniref:HNH endonuclease n=3 Tax=Mycobacterium virus Wildcat TaxID=1993859 RepID=Q19XY3_9CAUD|nr:HNH endonuclease [Mycobacterium phage Wildcat]ABE67682.1 hypothetical protein Wildcat_77 [Mycobacterium phage Wildcat]AQT25747.2 HNH endonuclease [Mycobacterium phage EniyanLRS]QGJ90034.1 HNH endonuclease [Mycobacterium phage MaryV]